MIRSCLSVSSKRHFLLPSTSRTASARLEISQVIHHHPTFATKSSPEESSIKDVILHSDKKMTNESETEIPATAKDSEPTEEELAKVSQSLSNGAYKHAIVPACTPLFIWCSGPFPTVSVSITRRGNNNGFPHQQPLSVLLWVDWGYNVLGNILMI